MSKNYTFNPGDFVVYPAHGVGRVTERQTINVDGQDQDFIAVHFTKNNMTMKIPPQRAIANGLRQVATPVMMESVTKVLCKKPKPRRIQWNKRNAEYTTKIGSGDPVALAEVIREVYKDPTITNQTFSEKEVYKKALDRLAPEYAIIRQISEADACAEIESMLKGEISAK